MMVIIWDAVSMTAFTQGGCTKLAHLDKTSSEILVTPTTYGTAGFTLENKGMWAYGSGHCNLDCGLDRLSIVRRTYGED